MKRLTLLCAWLVLGCGGDDDGKQPAPGRDDRGDGGITRDGDRDDEDPRVTGGSRGDGGPEDEEGSSSSDGTPGGDRGGSDAGVEGAQVLSELTDEQRESLCRAQIARLYTDAAIEQECVVEATLDASDAASCNAQAKECTADYRSTRDSDERDALEECLAGLRNCAYTVQQLEGCVAEEAAQWELVTRAYSCEQAGTRDPSEEPELEISEECFDLQDSCYFW